MTQMYSTKLRIIAPIEVEGDSPEEAERIIDGILENVGTIVVYEGTEDDPDDQLTCYKVERIERDDIVREQD